MTPEILIDFDIENYIAQIYVIEKSYGADLFLAPFFTKFWTHWIQIHDKVLRQLVGYPGYVHQDENLKEDFKAFLKKRLRMISGYHQVSKQNPNYEKIKPFFLKIIEQHDNLFMSFLKKIMDQLSIELSSFQRKKKVTMAYKHTAFLPGG